MPLRDVFGALREREFRRVFLARSSSIVGDGIAPIALTFAILDLTHGSASDLGIVLAAHTAPFVIFLLLGGVWADRLPRQRIMLASDLGRFATQDERCPESENNVLDLSHRPILVDSTSAVATGPCSPLLRSRTSSARRSRA